MLNLIDNLLNFENYCRNLQSLSVIFKHIKIQLSKKLYDLYILL